MDCENKVLMPGLINAHTHVPMTLLRGLADDLRLDVWLMGYMMPLNVSSSHPNLSVWAPSWPVPSRSAAA